MLREVRPHLYWTLHWVAHMEQNPPPGGLWASPCSTRAPLLTWGFVARPAGFEPAAIG